MTYNVFGGTLNLTQSINHSNSETAVKALTKLGVRDHKTHSCWAGGAEVS